MTVDGTQPRVCAWAESLTYGALLAVVLAVPTVFSARTIECGHIKNVILAFLVLAGTTLWVARTATCQRVEFTSSIFNVAVLCYWLAAASSVALSPRLMFSICAFWRLSLFALLYLLAANTVHTRRRITVLLTAVSVAAIAVCLYAFSQKLGVDPIRWSQSGRGRVFSSVGNPNMLAGYLVIVIPLAAALALGIGGRWARIVGSVTVLACVTSLSMTESKGAWLAAMVGAGIMSLCLAVSEPRSLDKLRQFFRDKRVAVLLAPLLIAAVCFVGWNGVLHFRRTFGGSARVRIVYWQGALSMFRDNPIAGAGLGTFQIFFPRHRPAGFRDKGVTYNTLHAHSEYLETLAEQGVVGGAALLFLLGTIAVVGFRALRAAQSSGDRWILSGLLSAIGGTLAHSSVSVVLRWSVCPTFLWLVLGLLVSMSALVSDGTRRRSFSLRAGRWQRAVLAVAFLVLVVSLGHGMVIRPFHAQLELRRGEECVRLGQWDPAIAAFNAAIRHDPAELRGYYKLAHAYFEQEHYQKAVETYRCLQVHAPDFAQVHCDLALAYTNLRKWDEATAEFTLAASMGTMPKEFSLASLQSQLEKTEEGEEKYVAVLNEIVRARPEDKSTWNKLAIWHFRKSQLDDAEECCEQALEVDAEYVPALNNLAGVYYQRRDFGKAIDTCNRLLAIDPKQAKTHVNLGRAHYLRGDKERAFECWHAALAIDPQEPEARKCIEELGGR